MRAFCKRYHFYSFFAEVLKRHMWGAGFRDRGRDFSKVARDRRNESLGDILVMLKSRIWG